MCALCEEITRTSLVTEKEKRLIMTVDVFGSFLSLNVRRGTRVKVSPLQALFEMMIINEYS